jgi:S1-C subfamily serine protease
MKRFALFFLVGACSMVGGLAASVLPAHWLTPVVAQEQSGGSSAGDLVKLSDRFEWVAKKVSPSVVALEAVKPAQPSSASNNKAKPVEESGSGVLVQFPSQKGVFVLTNNHVVAQAAPAQITINLADSKLVHPKQVWADAESDIALLLLDGGDSLTTAVLGDSENVRIGQWVLAMGSPFGLNQTLTHGIISARERGQIGLGSTIRIKDFLQTDAAINPGSSGGPLLNLDGEVIGINTAIASNSGSNSGVAFSIPINLVKRVARQLLEKGSVSRGYLGLQLAQAFESADALKLGMDRVQGALIETVYAETPAATAGLRSNDVVLEVDGFPIRNENHLINMISGIPAGQKVKLQVWRERKTITVDAVVGDWSKNQSRFKASP